MLRQPLPVLKTVKEYVKNDFSHEVSTSFIVIMNNISTTREHSLYLIEQVPQLTASIISATALIK